MKYKIAKLRSAVSRLAKLDRELDQIKINQGLILAKLQATMPSDSLADCEFKVFSQWGEDGIIQHLVRAVPIANRTFVEFGVEDFSESNCRFLLMKDYWAGYVIDGSERNISRLRSAYYFWKFPLRAKQAFVTRENIDELLRESGFDGDLGLLSVDIDGVDYFVLERIQAYWPRIIIVEYNAVFGKRRAVSVPYLRDFRRRSAHYSNLYYGASLAAFAHLLCGRNYALVGVNAAGNNAFFVRRDILPDAVKERTVDQCFRDSCFREGRTPSGHLSLWEGEDRRRQMQALPLVDVITGATLTVGQLEG